MTTATLFKEIVNGYGFEEVEQTTEGLYCDGCMVTHKRPTKMYSSDRGVSKHCRNKVLYFYGDAIEE